MNSLILGCIYLNGECSIKSALSRKTFLPGSWRTNFTFLIAKMYSSSPLAAGQHLPLSPLARTPSPGPERFQVKSALS